MATFVYFSKMKMDGLAGHVEDGSNAEYMSGMGKMLGFTGGLIPG